MATLSTVPRFECGQVVHHKTLRYRGLILGVDEEYRGSEEGLAASTWPRSFRDQPWYHVLIHDSSQEAYVAEKNLELQDEDEPAEVDHPLVWVFFDEVVKGRYVRTRLMS
jgi:heat shock protein HspQ